ncbi:MAG: GAF domain-containing protein, partial [Ilumatobacteraceae bacterium]
MGEQDEAPAADAGTTDWHQLVLAAVHDPDRLAAVQATGLLDTAAEESFDRLARLAATVLRVPWVFVTLVDEKRSFWKSCVGVELDDVSPRQNSVDESFCQYVIGSGDRVVVTDARLDERTKSNISIELMGVISWAGVPLRGGDRQILGTMCAVDSVVRNWTVADMELLETLAGAASSEIQLRTALATANDATKELAAELATREVIVERSRMLADLAQQLSAAESSDAVCSIMTNLGRSVLAAEFSNVAVLDEEQRHLNLVHSSWLVSEVAQRYATLALTADAPLAH